jgi:acetyl-CoA carboxylase biotin carboxyl carrier protein
MAKSQTKKPSVDHDLIRELTELLDETGLTEIEIEQDDHRIRVARNLGHAAPGPAHIAPAVSAPAPVAMSTSASAVECTATVGMPRSLQARSTRMAISPRLAIRILSNIIR